MVGPLQWALVAFRTLLFILAIRWYIVVDSMPLMRNFSVFSKSVFHATLGGEHIVPKRLH